MGYIDQSVMLVFIEGRVDVDYYFIGVFIGRSYFVFVGFQGKRGLNLGCLLYRNIVLFNGVGLNYVWNIFDFCLVFGRDVIVGVWFLIVIDVVDCIYYFELLIENG